MIEVDGCELCGHTCKPQWISVADRLPNKDAVVLIWEAASDCTGFDLGYWTDYGWFRETHGGEQTFCTHWMPLPEPPK